MTLEVVLGGKVIASVSVAGGYTNEVEQVEISNGRFFLVKSNPQAPDAFQREAEGLHELARSLSVRVPQVIYFDERLLVTEWVDSGLRNPLTFREFGKNLARLHQFKHESWGFHSDNYCGQTPQKNTPAQLASDWKWADFYFDYRLHFQMQLAENSGFVDDVLRRDFAALSQARHDLLPEDGEPPCLLHGDLWSGNYLISQEGEAVIIDPAVYYGHREAELAMTRLFGGFPDEFYEAYNDEYALASGWEQRQPIYQLYHLLNHLNLTKGGYYGQVLSTIQLVLRLVRS